MYPASSGVLTPSPPRTRTLVGTASMGRPYRIGGSDKKVRVAVTVEGILDAFYTRFTTWYNAQATAQGLTPVPSDPLEWHTPSIAGLLGCEPSQASAWLAQFYKLQLDTVLTSAIEESLFSTRRIMAGLAEQGVVWRVIVARHGAHADLLQDWLASYYPLLRHVSVLPAFDCNADAVDPDVLLAHCREQRARVLVHNEPRTLRRICTPGTGLNGMLFGPETGWMSCDQETEPQDFRVRRVPSWHDMQRALSRFMQ